MPLHNRRKTRYAKRHEEETTDLPFVILLVSSFFLGYGFGNSNGKNAVKVATLEASNKALARRLTENDDLAAKQKADNQTITKAKEDELTKVRADLATAKRLRVGPALCPATRQATTESTGSGNAADTGGGLVSASTQQAIDGLILKVEEGFATGRACQRFLVANELVP